MRDHEPQDTSYSHPRSLRANTALVLASLSSGALLLLVVVGGFFLSGERYAERATHGWDGASLRLLAGSGGTKNTDLSIENLDSQGRALLALPIRALRATGAERLNVHVSGWQPQHLEAALVWREASAPRRLHSVALPLIDGANTIDLFGVEGWSGEIAAPLIILVEGVLPEPFAIQRVELLPMRPKPAALLRTILQEWTAFEGWRGHSINFLAGGSRNPLVSPILATALWVLFSAAVYVVLSLVGRWPLRGLPFAVIFLVGWIALDARWQWDLIRQVQATHIQFAEISHDQRTHNTIDSALFDLAHIVKTEFAGPDARVIMLPDRPMDGPHHYQRVRLHHHLLPLNAASVWNVPHGPLTVPGDLVIVFSNHTRLTYDEDAGTLLWDRNRTLAVERLFEHPLATVYRAL